MKYKICLFYALILHVLFACIFFMYIFHAKNTSKNSELILHTYLTHQTKTQTFINTHKTATKNKFSKQQNSYSSAHNNSKNQYSKLLTFLHNKIQAGIYQNSDLVAMLQNRTVTIKFAINKSGYITNINLAKGTGLQTIDQMIISVVNDIGFIPQDLLASSKHQFVINIVKD